MILATLLTIAGTIYMFKILIVRNHFDKVVNYKSFSLKKQYQITLDLTMSLMLNSAFALFDRSVGELIG